MTIARIAAYSVIRGMNTPEGRRAMDTARKTLLSDLGVKVIAVRRSELFAGIEYPRLEDVQAIAESMMGGVA